MNQVPMASKGLAGVVVDETAISDVRAEGALIYRGHPIETLAERSFTEVASLVVTGELSNRLDGFLAGHANLEPWETAAVLTIPAACHPMRMLASLLPVLAVPAEAVEGLRDDAVSGLVAAAKVPALVATHLTRAEVHIHNIRHIQHHAAQLILRLRRDYGQDMPWFKSGWPDTAT